jgi:hypothetical protein
MVRFAFQPVDRRHVITTLGGAYPQIAAANYHPDHSTNRTGSIQSGLFITHPKKVNSMKATNRSLRSLLVIASLAGTTLIAGCNAASLTGPEPSDVQATGGTGGGSNGENEPRNL